MSMLSERLKTSCPELWQAHTNSWRLAIKTWLPMVDARCKSDSFNSFPHLLNLENHLDRIILDYEKHMSGSEKTKNLELSPVEIYVICSCILFHDIGRIRNTADHGKESKALLVGESSDLWAQLGIYSKELAEIIAAISELHTNINDINTVSSTAVNPFGRIRMRELAALLILIDEMDDTYNRVLLKSIEPNPMDIRTFLRRAILEVYLDLKKQTIFVVMSENEEIETIRTHYGRLLNDKQEKLLIIKHYLSCLGIQVCGWVLQHKENLYNIVLPPVAPPPKIEDAYEACFNKKYLDDVVDRMWYLCTQIFGTGSLTYENLAAAMSETDVDKIRIAVHRLSILSRKLCRENPSLNGLEIQADQKHWKWPVKPKSNEPAIPENRCLYLEPNQLKKLTK